MSSQGPYFRGRETRITRRATLTSRLFVALSLSDALHFFSLLRAHFCSGMSRTPRDRMPTPSPLPLSLPLSLSPFFTRSSTLKVSGSFGLGAHIRARNSYSTFHVPVFIRSRASAMLLVVRRRRRRRRRRRGAFTSA